MSAPGREPRLNGKKEIPAIEYVEWNTQGKIVLYNYRACQKEDSTNQTRSRPDRGEFGRGYLGYHSCHCREWSGYLN